MMKLSQISLIAAAALFTVACSSDMQSKPVDLNAMAKPSIQSDSKTGHAWVSSPQKHNNSGISMRYQINGELAVGKPVKVNLEFSGATSADASVMITPPASLAMGMTDDMQQTNEGYTFALANGALTSRTVSFTPNAEGEHFIGFSLAQNGRGSASGIMLRFGSVEKNKELPNSAKIVTNDGGEKLVVMPEK
jgi:hypothetical protein